MWGVNCFKEIYKEGSNAWFFFRESDIWKLGFEGREEIYLEFKNFK